MINIHALAQISEHRPIYCWGAGRYGMMASDALRRAGVKIAGFIDKTIQSSRGNEIKIIHPDALNAEHLEDRDFVVVTSMFFEDEIEQALLSKGYFSNKDYIRYSALKQWSFEIDVAGVCQLRCPTCPNGNFSGSALPKTMMDLAFYCRILDKLIAEVDFLPDIQLYSWGEPLLNPALPDMVAYAVEQGISVGISSNLNDVRHLERTVQAKPEWFRVSLSGVDERYQLTHRGGDWERVSRNIDLLAKYRALYNPEMTVEINYHLYKNNEADIPKIISICTKHGFLFKPNAAYIDPLDTIIDYAQGKSLPGDMAQTAQELLLDIDIVLQDCRAKTSPKCVLENTVVIHSDGSIRLCPHAFGTQYKLNSGILELPIREIFQLFSERSLCKQCKALGLNNFYAHFLSLTDYLPSDNSVGGHEDS